MPKWRIIAVFFKAPARLLCAHCAAQAAALWQLHNLYEKGARDSGKDVLRITLDQLGPAWNS